MQRRNKESVIEHSGVEMDAMETVVEKGLDHEKLGCNGGRDRVE